MAEAEQRFSFRYSLTARERREGLKMLRTPPWSMPGTSKKAPMSHTAIGVAIGIAIVALVARPPGWFITLFIIRGAPNEDRELTQAVAILVGMGCAWGAGSAWLLRLAVFQRLRCWASALVISIDDRGVAESVPGVSTCFAWSRYRGMAEGKNVIILWNAIDRGLIIPKRLFGDSTQLATAITFMQSHTAKQPIPVPAGFEVMQ
jgi:hypothetical protein